MTGRLKRKDVMLASLAEEAVIAKLPRLLLAQPKLNGERARGMFENDMNYHFYSSYGTRFKFLEKQEEALRVSARLSWSQYHDLDGEFYKHGWSRERIHSVVSRKTNPHPDIKDIEYHVFDMYDFQYPGKHKPACVRERVLSCLVESDRIKLVPTTLIYKEDIVSYTAEQVALGYEGGIFRDPDALYVDTKCRAMVKFKPTKIDRYIIIGYEEEISQDGWAKGTLGALVVKDSSGIVFNVGSGKALTLEGRQRLWNKRETLKGKWAKVKHSEIMTVNGMPTCTSLLEVEVE